MLKIVFFGRLREVISIDELSIEVYDLQPCTVQNIIKLLEDKYSLFKDYIEQGNRLMIAVNQEISAPERLLQSGDELALFPPVTGG